MNTRNEQIVTPGDDGRVYLTTAQAREPSPWVCYLFGNTPSGNGFVYHPVKGGEPNWFVRWMMKVMLGCTWVKLSKPGDKKKGPSLS